jgi:DNA-binding CsgD family transcriptional regulator
LFSIHELTRAELRILRLVAEGVTNRGIAEQLGISEKSVEKHMGEVLFKATGLTDKRAREVRVQRRVVAAVEYKVWSSRYPTLVPRGN